MESIIHLIMSFFASACILFCFKAGLLGLFYVLIYVGAVAVLFLFLIMMLQIKVPSTNQGFVTIVSRLVIIALTGSTIGTILSYFISQLWIDSNKDFTRENQLLENFTDPDNLDNEDFFETKILNFHDESWNFLINNFGSDFDLGNILFGSYWLIVLLAGIALLIALIGAIILTKDNNERDFANIKH